MRLVTWNCANGKYELKRKKLLELQPDIASSRRQVYREPLLAVTTGLALNRL